MQRSPLVPADPELSEEQYGTKASPSISHLASDASVKGVHFSFQPSRE